ncbi:NAD(P)-binding protein [Metschnikowia bicuspidata var. bicuspidata NRRL YB-4993]|uniref:NAD(P)-binding protein n=1 Tax=Metschnikowia bicuspidata var. bicuspidata NRRL YB-4993 TaxID=869754 RepID=A0A1A0HF21_9ASCO|nr:NAD(P)-binding protein [Metschnikowia bicuspidata var. bicuspidata NRRL YB-4993]OBA22601.1 NAD(P)-binding protein [Metschnikowia bicuspidata var. bicuspidata NRRL YB-4993]
MSTTVFVSGATGFVGQHLVQLLIAKKYHVVGTVETIEQGNHLQRLFNSKNFTYEIVKATGVPNPFANAFKRHPEITVFIQTQQPRTHEEPSVKTDMLNVLHAIKDYAPQIEHVVVTSTAASFIDTGSLYDSACTICEGPWSPVTCDHAENLQTLGCLGFTEKTAWDFYDNTSPTYTLSVISPAHVFGPQAFDVGFEEKLNSVEIISDILSMTPESEVPLISGQFIDARDLARAYLVILERRFSHKRFLLSSESFSGQAILDILRQNFYSLRNELPEGTPGEGKSESQAGNSTIREILGDLIIDLHTSVVDSVNQIMRAHKKEYCPPGMFLQKGHRVFRAPTTFE